MPDGNTKNENVLLKTLEKAILDPDLPDERINSLIQLMDDQDKKAAEKEFNISLVAAMSEMPTIPRSGKSNRNTYSTIDDIINTTRPILSKHGLFLNWECKTIVENSIVFVTAILSSKNGFKISSKMSASFDSKGDNDAQKARSAMTYLQRYSATGLLGLSTGDNIENDGAQIITVNEEQFSTLKKTAELAKVSESKILKAFNQSSFEEFDASLYPSAIKKLESTIKKNNEAVTA